MSSRHPASWLRLPGLLLAAVCFLSTPALRAETPPSKEEVARLVRQLGDKHFSKREQASRLLWKAGQAAEPALQAALKSEDAEVVRRARAVLEKFKYGLYPDTPPQIVQLIHRYRKGDVPTRQQVAVELLKLGRPGYRTLFKLADSEANADYRRSLLQTAAHEAADQARIELAEGNVADAEELLTLALTSEQDTALHDYAAFHLLRGTLEARIREFEERARTPRDKRAAEMLVYLYRAKGDLAAARDAARRSGKPELLQGVLEEQADWKALAAMMLKKADQDVTPAVKALYAHLAGDERTADAELRKVPEDDRHPLQGRGDPDTIPFQAFFFTGRTDRGIGLLAEARLYARAFELLALQTKLREAFALADRGKGRTPEAVRALDIARAQTYVRLGDLDTASQLFARVAEELKGPNENFFQYAPLVRAEYEVGLKEQAFEHCADYLGRPPKKVYAERRPGADEVLEAVFGKQADAAEVWMQFLRQRSPREGWPAVLKRTRQLFEGRHPGKDFAKLMAEAVEWADRLPEHLRVVRLESLAETCLAVRQDELARTCLERAVKASSAPARLYQRLGDVCGRQRQWEQAAHWYRQAWESDKKQAVPLWLLGRALRQAGHAAEGRTFMDRAHWLPLGDDEARSQLARALAEHRQEKEAGREWDLLVRTGRFDSLATLNSLPRLAVEATAHKDYARTAACYERVLVLLLENGGYFTQPKAYLVVPYWAHFYRARALLAAGRPDEARRHIACCQAIMPGDVDLAIYLMPELEKHGRKKEADELFRQAEAHYTKLCTDYPKSPAWHNTLAWLDARCHRELDRALAHAKEAVRLDRKNAGLLDTLAEVHFQRGDRARAVALMKRCIELDPGKEYFKKQLARFEAGEPRADVPAEGGAE